MKKKIIRITTVPMSLYELLQGQLGFMSQYYNVLGISSRGNNNELSRVNEYEGIPTIAVEMTRKITPLKDLLAAWELYKIFKKEKPYMVHSHTPKAGTLAMIASKFAGVPYRLHTIAGLPLVEATGLKRMLLNTVEKITYACASKIYPNSFGLQDIILENNFTSKDKLKVIANGSSNGIDTQYFNPLPYANKTYRNKLRSEINIEKNDFVFIYIGRLVGDKGINELIRVFNTLSNNYKNIKLVLVGTYETEFDPLKPETLKIINSNRRIVPTGWKDDVRPYLGMSDALSFPSYREGFPNVVMQAGAMELPSIVTNINGCNEIIRDYESGIIVPIKNENALFFAMEYLLKNKDKAKLMGINSRKHIQSNFERQVVWSAILEEYKKLN